MSTPTVQDFVDAKVDVDDLEAIVNGSTTVTTRQGGDKLSVDQALSQIVVGQVTVYSAATQYTAIEEWVEEAGVMYRPLPSQLPIGPEAFDPAKWSPVNGLNLANLQGTQNGSVRPDMNAYLDNKEVADYAALRAALAAGAYRAGDQDINVLSPAGPGFTIVSVLSGTVSDNTGTVITANGAPAGIGELIAVRVWMGAADVRWFGAKLDYNVGSNTGTDDTAAIQLAVNETKSVYIQDELSARLDGMLLLDGEKRLKLGNKSRLRRTNHTANADPVIWIRGDNNVLEGAGYGASRIQTANKCANGAVLVGQWDMTAAPYQTNYNTIKDIGIWGGTGYGQTTGTPDVALLLQAPEIGGTPVYFQNIRGIQFANANYGMESRGWANGNLVSEIHGFFLGADNVNGGALFYDRGSLDNSINIAFHHFSTNGVTIKMEEYDNTVNGGAIHKCFATSYNGIVCEQSGPAARGLRATDGTVGNCSIQIMDNASAGIDVDAGFNDRNSLFTKESWRATARNIAQAPTFHNYQNANKTECDVYERALILQGMAENQYYEVFEFNANQINSQVLVEVTIGCEGTGPNYSQKVTCLLSVSGGGTVTYSLLDNKKSGNTSRGLCEPIITGINVLFNYKTFNNGTATTNQGVHCFVRIVGNHSSVVFNESLVIGSSSTVIP